MRHTRIALIAAVLAALTTAAVSTGLASAATKVGRITQFNLPPPNGPGDIAVGPDGNLWFATGSGCCGNPSFDVGMLTPSGQFTGFNVPTPSGSNGMVAGPDGRMWFIDNGGIGAIDTSPDHLVTEYPIPPIEFSSGSAPVSPRDLTAGPDGAVWFTAFVNSPCCGQPDASIGRIDVGGGVSELLLPSPQSFLGGITTGADGALWFADFGTGSIGRMTTAGAFTSFPTPRVNGFTEAVFLTSGPDGNIWFTDSELNTINRMTLSGHVTAFKLTSQNPIPEEITAGPDGAMWFTEAESSSAGLGRITMQGKITEFITPAGGGSEGITAGPPSKAHTVWFTQPSTNNIDFITTK